MHQVRIEQGRKRIIRDHRVYLVGAILEELVVMFCLTKCDGQPPLCEKRTGGADVPVVGMGYRGLL
jgi:hypothetical protein